MFTVYAEDRGLVMDHPRPELLGMLPEAFELGPSLIGMPHSLSNCLRLSAMGYTPPSPIEYYYSWPREVTLIPQPFKHQMVSSGFLTLNPHAYCFNDIGTGKTLTAAWAADYLMSIGAAQRFIIAAPLSTLERVWADALFYHFRHRKFVVLHGSAARRRKLLCQPADFYIVNHDGVGVIQKELAARPDIDGWIIDELAVYRNKSTVKHKTLMSLLYPSQGEPKPWVWGFTGSPIPNEPTDAYGQCRLVTPHTVPKYYSQFQNLVMEPLRPVAPGVRSSEPIYLWRPRKEALTIVHQAMRPAIRYKRTECLDLPPTITQMRDINMSSEQTRHYKELMRELYTEVKGGRVTAVNEGVLRSKLLQVACGVVYDINGEPRQIDAGNRIDTLLELIEQVNEKVIVFVPFTAVTAMLAKELNKHWNFAVVTGSTPIKERNQIFSDFQDPSKDIDLLAHPECMAHGLTLTQASTIIWYAPIDSHETYEQANGRPDRAGKLYTLNIVQLAGSAVERKMYKRLDQRQTTQGVLLSMVEAGEQ